jgi:hypothetical protein
VILRKGRFKRGKYLIPEVDIRWTPLAEALLAAAQRPEPARAYGP